MLESESLYFWRICSFLDRYAILFVADMQLFVVDMQFFALFTNKTIYFWSHGTQFRGQWQDCNKKTCISDLSVIIGGSKGGARDAPPRGSKFFHFHAVFGKNVKNNSKFGSWRPPPGENPGSATGYGLHIHPVNCTSALHFLYVCTHVPYVHSKFCQIMSFGPLPVS